MDIKRGSFPFIIRRSTALLIIRVVLTELLFEFLYIFWRFLIDVNLLGVSGETLVFIHSSSIFIFFILVTVFQTSVIIFIFLDWNNRYCEIHSEEIVLKTGIVTNKEKAYPYRDIQSIRLEQGILGRLFNYGSVSIYIPTLGYDLHFTEIPNPKKFIKMIKDRTSDVKGERFLFKRG